MPNQNTLTQDRLKELLHYDPETGEFTWRLCRGGRVAGTPAGHIKKDGYIKVRIDKVDYFAHRLAWLDVHGVWPPEYIDHINAVRDDNRIANLRLATSSENQQNIRHPSRNNKLGVLGVSRHRDKFRAQIKLGRVPIYLGVFLTLEEAEQAYIEAKNKHHLFSPFADAA